MYNKMVIRNVGVLRAFDAGAAPPLSKLSLFMLATDGVNQRSLP
jgi:hypothetical protein